MDDLIALKVLCENTNASVYEVKYGKPPGRIVRDVIEIPTEFESIEIEDSEEYSIEMVDDFSIELEDDDNAGNGIELEDDEDNSVLVSQTLAKGNEARFVLEDPSTRSQIMDDLAELESFLAVRQDAVTENIADKNRIDSWMELINNIYKSFNEENMQNLFRLADNPQTADRIVEQLEKHKVFAINFAFF